MFSHPLDSTLAAITMVKLTTLKSLTLSLSATCLNDLNSYEHLSAKKQDFVDDETMCWLTTSKHWITYNTTAAKKEEEQTGNDNATIKSQEYSRPQELPMVNTIFGAIKLKKVVVLDSLTLEPMCTSLAMQYYQW